MNFSDFETHVRAAMSDPIQYGDDTTATWKTDEIVRYYNDAVAAYSQHFARQMTSEITVVAGTTQYDLPSDIIQPPDSALELVRWRRSTYEYEHMMMLDWPPGSTERISVSGTGQGFYLWGSKFILADEPTTADASYPIELWYRALHQTVDEDSYPQSDVALTIPEADKELPFWYVTANMMGKLEASDANLRRWAERRDGGLYRDDNPPRKSSEWRMEQYLSGVAIRLGRKGPIRLVRR